MALARDEGSAWRQLAALGQGADGIFGREHIVQPVVQQAAHAGLVELEQVDEGLEAIDFLRRCQIDHRRRIQGQLGRRRIIEKGLGPVDIGHFERGGAFAQDRLHRSFPALLDVQLLPQARERVEFVLLQPWLHLALGLDAFLQLLEGRQARFELRVGGRFRAHLGLGLRTLLFHALLLFRGFLEQHRLLFERLLLFFQLQAQVGQMAAVREIEAAFFLLQALAPRDQAIEDIVGIALMRRFQFDLLLRLHNFGA